MKATFANIEKTFIDAGMEDNFKDACRILLPRLELSRDRRKYINCVVLDSLDYESSTIFIKLLIDMADKMIGTRVPIWVNAMSDISENFWKDSEQEWLEAGVDSELHFFIIDGIDVPRVFLEKCLLYPNCTTLVIPPSKVEVNGEVNLLNVEVRPSQRIFDKYLRDLVNEHDAQIIGALSHDFKSIRTAVINAKTEAALRMWKNDCVFKFVPVLALKDEDAKIK